MNRIPAAKTGNTAIPFQSELSSLFSSNAWTAAGGVIPEDWPNWMRNFKDY
jgi:hypothetical protein